MYSNLTGDGTRTYTYDAADRLKTVTQGGTTTTFAYDGLGRRLKQTVGSTETRYLWCGAAICQQRSNTDVVQKRFFAEGEYVLTGTKKYLTLTDHLGSVRDLIDITSTPTLVGSFDYTPYGAVARSWGTVTPGYTYAGLFAHPSTGLLLSATRAYEPTKGRWLNKDPIRERGGINLYGYVGASPMLFNDPLGLDPIGQSIGGWVGGWGGRVGGAFVGEVIFPAGGGIPGAIAGGAGGRRLGMFIGDRIGDAIIAVMSQAQNCPPDIKADDLKDKSQKELEELAKNKGLIPDPKKPNKFRDPKTGDERIRIDPGHIDDQGRPYRNPNAARPHVHGYDGAGNKIVDPVTGDPHFPIKIK